MNKLTTTLAGFALLAAAGVVPASAQTFTNNGPFTFTYNAPTVSVSNISATFNPQFGTSQTGLLSLMGQTTTPGGATLTFVSGGNTLSQTVTAFVNPMGPTTDFISGFAPATAFSTGFTFDLMNGTPQAVPEASTVLSFGALIALGGLAVLRRKTAVKAA